MKTTKKKIKRIETMDFMPEPKVLTAKEQRQADERDILTKYEEMVNKVPGRTDNPSLTAGGTANQFLKKLLKN